MGDDEIIPNGSVHWSITHEQALGGGGRQRRPWNKAGDIATNNKETVELGPGQDSIRGIDRIGTADVERLEVTLRFRTREELQAALTGAIAKAVRDNRTGLWVAEFNIESNGANVNEQQAGGPTPNPWAQVRVHW